MMVLTNQDIQEDIQAFEKRIHEAQVKLAALPVHSYDWREQRKLDKKRRVLISEIKHVKRLIEIAKSGLSDGE